MNDAPNPDRATRDQLRRQFLDQAAAAFDRMFPVEGAEQTLPLAQREQRAREVGQQLVASLLRQNVESDAGFLRDIIERPGDDTPRLVYADWLDDHDQPARAEFIRLQCQIDKLDPDDPERQLLKLREEDLLEEHGIGWMAYLPDWARKGAQMQRGFVGHLSLPAKRYLKDGKALRQQGPLDSLRLSEFGGRAEDLAASGLLSGIRHLMLSGNGQPGSDVAAILGSAHLADLVSLSLSRCPVSEEVCQALVANTHLGRLKRLAFISNAVGPDQATILSRSPLLGQLHDFELLSTEVGTAGVRLLAASPHWRQLRRLSLDGCWLETEAVRELIRSPMVKGLTSLSLCPSYTGEAARDLARTPSLKNLLYLDLTYSHIGDGGLEALANSSHLARLTSLGLTNNQLTADGMRALARGRLLARLTQLVVHDDIGTEGVRSLTESPNSRQLRYLSLSHHLGPDAAAALAASPHLPALVWLSLYLNGIGPVGARALAESANFPALCYLDVSSNRIGSEGARALADSRLMSQLRRLVLSSNGVSMPLRRQLQARFGQRVRF